MTFRHDRTNTQYNNIQRKSNAVCIINTYANKISQVLARTASCVARDSVLQR